MSKTKNSKVTIANIVTMLGLAALAIFVFCGHALQNYENNFGTNIIVASTVVLGTLFVLWLMIHSKQAEDNFRNWRIVEILAIILFLVVSYFSGTKMMKFFVVNEKMVVLKEKAIEDIDSLAYMMAKFDMEENNRLERTKTLYSNAKMGNYNYSDDVHDFIKIVDDNGGADFYFEKLGGKIDRIEDSGNTTAYRTTWEKEIKELDGIIQNWNLILLPGAVKNLETLSKVMNEKLTAISKNAEFQDFDESESNIELTESSPSEYKYDVKFPEQVKDTDGFSVVGLLIIIFIDVLVLASYIFAYRSHKVVPKGKTAFLGGAPLN